MPKSRGISVTWGGDIEALDPISVVGFFSFSFVPKSYFKT